MYTYDVEDGQFSFQIELHTLLGKEGDIIYISPNGIDPDASPVKILKIDGNLVICRGSVEYPLD